MKIDLIKIPVFVLFPLVAVQFGSCRQIKESTYHLKVEVRDEAGSSVDLADVMTSRDVLADREHLLTRAVRETGRTNDGLAEFWLASVNPPTGIVVSKNNYYDVTERVVWSKGLASGKADFVSESSVVLKPVRKPIPMHANSMMGEGQRYVRIPELNKEYAYDLMLCEPLPPLGQGKTADFHFRLEGSFDSTESNNLVLKIRFPNSGEGLVEFLTPNRSGMHDPSIMGSQLQSGYEAPQDGYGGTLERTFSISPGSGVMTNAKPVRNHYFRCRTRFADDGSVISAHYGKIYGDFDLRSGNKEKGFLGAFGWSCSYFNPNENDRNVEFDVGRNLHPASDVRWP